jgi:hypothetical protein
MGSRGFVYCEPWEWEYETRGPIRETVHPDLHACTGEGLQFGTLAGVPYWRMVPLIERTIAGKSRMLDLGGGIVGPPNPGQQNPLPGAVNWELSLGRDMRDEDG